MITILGYITALCSLGFILGKAADLFLIKKQKGELYIKIESLWKWLKGKSVANLSFMAAQSVLRFYRTAFASDNPKKFLIRLFLISSFLTTLIFSLSWWFHIDNLLEWEYIGIKGFYFNWFFLANLTGFIIINFILDFLTIKTTINLLSHITKKISFKNISIPVLDIIMSLLYALPLFIIGSFINLEVNGIPPLKVHLSASKQNDFKFDKKREIYYQILENDKVISNKDLKFNDLFVKIDSLNLDRHWVKIDTSALDNRIKRIKKENRIFKGYSIVEFKTELGTFYSSEFSLLSILLTLTTLVPTLIYQIIILFLLLCKIVLVLVRSISLIFLRRVIDDEPEKLQVFTLTGTLFGVIGGFFKMILTFIT